MGSNRSRWTSPQPAVVPWPQDGEVNAAPVSGGLGKGVTGGEWNLPCIYSLPSSPTYLNPANLTTSTRCLSLFTFPFPSLSTFQISKPPAVLLFYSATITCARELTNRTISPDLCRRRWMCCTRISRAPSSTSSRRSISPRFTISAKDSCVHCFTTSSADIRPKLHTVTRSALFATGTCAGSSRSSTLGATTRATTSPSSRSLSCATALTPGKTTVLPTLASSPQTAFISVQKDTLLRALRFGTT